MLLTTQDQFEDQQITQTLGLVKGSTIRAKHLGSDILSVLRHMVGGELTEYTKMLAESREQAIDRMIAEADRKNADGIVGLRFTTSSVMKGSAELLAYGTAVRLQPKPNDSSDSNTIGLE